MGGGREGRVADLHWVSHGSCGVMGRFLTLTPGRMPSETKAWQPVSLPGGHVVYPSNRSAAGDC
jgi:hypothetical protein